MIKVKKIAAFVMTATLTASCAWFTANSKTISADAVQLAACETNYILTAITPTPVGAVGACVGLALVDAEQLFATLGASTNDAGQPTEVARRILAGKQAK
jgi:hypothetical protein